MTRHLPESQRRAQILRAARAIFIERGYLAARIEDIAARARLSKGAVYFYFASKRDIFDALVEEDASALRDLARTDPLLPAEARILSVVRAYATHFQTPPRFMLLLAEMSIRDEDVRVRVDAMHRDTVAFITTLLEQGVDDGVFAPHSVPAVALLLASALDGFVVRAAAGRRPDTTSLMAATALVLSSLRSA